MLDRLASLTLSEWIRTARWGYALVNTAHVLGVALLVGAISTLNIRLIGFWRQIPVTILSPVLVSVAVAGLSLAVVSGVLLFLANPVDYAGLWLFILKMGLVTLGVLHALTLQFRCGLAELSEARQRLAGIVSLTIWLSALVCGRMIAFVGD